MGGRQGDHSRTAHSGPLGWPVWACSFFGEDGYVESEVVGGGAQVVEYEQRTARRAHRRRPRIAYLVRMSRSFRHDEDTDLIDGVYVDQEGEPLGAIVLREQRGGPPDTFLVVAAPGVVAVHAEGVFEADHRVTSYERLAAVVYPPEVTAPPGVERDGERWDTGEEVVYTFESDEDALLAQG